MAKISDKIGQLKAKDYDRKIFTIKEIGAKTSPDMAKSLDLCEEFKVETKIILSELIYTRDELTELKDRPTNFRNQNSNDSAIAKLSGYIFDLEEIFREKTHQAQKMKAYKAKEDRHAAAIKTLEPLADELAVLDQKMKDHIEDIRVVETSVFVNSLKPETFRLMNAMSRPSGVFE